jgi:uncharacterized repeat protein (TIGR01451 family)
MDPGSEWLWDNTPYNVPVYPGTPCACIIFYNEYNPGCLEVYKTVNWNGIAPFPMDFVIEVRGPAPDTTLVATLHFDEYGNPIGSNTISPLIPGDYTITEINPGLEWEIIGSPQTITVYPGTPCATATIYNTRIGLEIVKEVWDFRSSSWVDNINVYVGADIICRITVTSIGGTFHNLIITDTLSEQLEYRNLANHTEFYISPDLREIIWHFIQLNSGESIEIIYHAEAVSMCQGWNLAEVTTDEQLSGNDIAMIKINTPNNPIIITKQVWDDNSNSWSNSVNVYEGMDVQFKITVTNDNSWYIDLINVEVTDYLPSFLSYNYDGNPLHSYTTDHYIEWTIGPLTPGSTETITYSANANNVGEGDNFAFAIGDFLSSTVADANSTHVIVDTAPSTNIKVIKQVFDGNSWTDSIIVYQPIEPVEFRIIVKNTGLIDLNNIEVSDNLPNILTYNYDSNPIHSYATDHHIEWTIGTLTPGNSVIITYSANPGKMGEGDNYAYAEAYSDTMVSDSDSTHISIRPIHCITNYFFLQIRELFQQS